MRQIRAERREREVLEDDAAQQPGRDLERQHRESDQRDERDEAEPRRGQNRRGGRSMGPATRSASASGAIVPALTTKVRIEPPTSTRRPAATKAARAAGFCVSDAMIAVTMSRASPRSSSDMLVSRSRATRNAP